MGLPKRFIFEFAVVARFGAFLGLAVSGFGAVEFATGLVDFGVFVAVLSKVLLGAAVASDIGILCALTGARGFCLKPQKRGAGGGQL